MRIGSGHLLVATVMVFFTTPQFVFANDADRYVGGVVLGDATQDQFNSPWYRRLGSNWFTRRGIPHWRDILADAEYNYVNPDSQSAHPYTIMNLHYAWALGYTGAGQVIAISDNMQFAWPDDPEFTGRIAGCYTQLGTNSYNHCYRVLGGGSMIYHGHMVMGVAAAARNGIGTVGVAPDALIYEVEWSDIEQSVRHAIAADAIAYNMSWSFNTDRFNPFNAWSNDSFRRALNDFQRSGGDRRGGVVVVSVPNDASLRDQLADLPHFHPELRDAWISVADADIRLNEATGEIWVDHLRSAECGLSARWCAIGNGRVRTTGMWGRDQVEGSSFGTAEYSGAVAVIAGPFPNSTGPELKARLLATANNTMFLPGGRNFDENRVLATEPFGVDGCASHTYAPDLGHGVIDIRAAMQPICTLVAIIGNDLATGRRVPVDDAQIVGPRGIVGWLDGEYDMFIGLVDGIGGEFTTMVNKFIHRAERQYQRRQARLAARLAAVSEAPSFAYVDHAEGDAIGRLHWQQADAASGMTLRFGVGDDIAAGIDGWSGLGMTTGALSLVGEGGYAGFGLNEGPLAGLEFTSFIGRNAWHDGPVYGIDGRVRKSFGPIDASLGVRLIGETGSYFGLHSASDLWTGSETVLSAVHTHLSHSISDRISLVAAGEFGVGYGGDGAFVHYLAPALYSSAAVGVNVKDTLADDDRLWLTLSQPLRLEHAPVRLTLPSGRTLEGDITHETYFRDMAPDRRQLDLGLSYARPLGDTGIAGFAVTHSFNDEHLAGANATNIEAFLSVTF